MIQELLFTSYEGRGLNKAGGGFCTVLSTQGMAVNLASALEKLSGYRHPFDLHDPRSHHNPVNFRLAVLTIGGTKFRVLSRIADLRHEHTGRSNKLAHHVTFADRQDPLPIGGPTTVLRSGVCRDSWDRVVRQEQAISPAALPQYDLPPGLCEAWKRVAGDAGWAGVVAEALLAERDAVYHVIYPLQTDVLALVEDVFRLIPPRKRWDLTFSTYYTAALPGSSCQLRFLLDGTPEAEHLRRDYRQAKIDLCDPSLGTAPDSPLVAAARSGVVRHAEAEAPARDAGGAGRVAGRSGAAALDDDDRFAFDPVAMATYSGAARSRVAAGDDDIRLGPPIARGRGEANDAGVPPRVKRGEHAGTTNYTKVALIAVAALFLLALFVGVGAGGFALAIAMSATAKEETTPSPPQGDASVDQQTDAADGNGKAKGENEGIATQSGEGADTPQTVSDGAGDGAASTSDTTEGQTSKTERDASSESNPDQPTGPVVSLSEGVTSTTATETPPPDPAADVPDTDPEPAPTPSTGDADAGAPAAAEFSLPENAFPLLTASTDGSAPEVGKPVVLRTKLNAEAASFELLGVSALGSVDPQRRPQIGTLVANGSAVELQWSGNSLVPEDFEKKPVGTFLVDQGAAVFRWDAGVQNALKLDDRRRAVNSLRFGMLRVTAGEKTQYLALCKPEKAVRLEIAPPSEPKLLPRPDAMFPRRGTLEFRIDLDGLPPLDKHSLTVDLLRDGLGVRETAKEANDKKNIPADETNAEKNERTERVKHLKEREAWLEQLDPADRDPQGVWLEGIEIKCEGERVLEAKFAIDQVSEKNDLRAYVQTTAVFAYAGDENVVIPSTGNWARAVNRLELVAKRASDDLTKRKAALQEAQDDKQADLTILKSDVEKAERIKKIAVAQKALFDALNTTPLMASLSVGANYGGGAPVLWIYGGPEGVAKQ